MNTWTPIPSSRTACLILPGEAVRSRPFNTVKASWRSGSRICVIVPGTTVLARPLEKLQVTTLNKIGSCHLGLGTTVPARSLGECEGTLGLAASQHILRSLDSRSHAPSGPICPFAAVGTWKRLSIERKDVL